MIITDVAGNLSFVTPNVGTVTQVGGTGSGLGFSLSGNVTSSGNLTLTVPNATSLTSSMGLGNVSVLNLNGNGSQALLGNGVFGPVTTSPAGSNTQIQFNSNGAFAASSDFVYDTTVGGGIFKVGGNITKVSIGSNSSAGTFATAIGDGAKAGGYAVVALGQNANIVGSFSIGMGFNTTTTTNHSIAIGTNANVTADNSVAIGLNSIANIANSIVLGTSYNTAMIPGILSLTGFTEKVLPNINIGSGGTIAPDVKLGTVLKYTANGNFTFNGFTNPLAGQSATIIITQGVGGSKLMTSTMKFVGGDKTLSTAAGDIDVISVFYDGTNYLASLTRGYA
jgi:hypothetical protein